MSIYSREDTYIKYLSEHEYRVKELAVKLFVSEPTVRRDISKLRKKGLLTCEKGIVRINKNAPDQRIPLFVREIENNDAKIEIARKASLHIKDGNVIMMDASTTAYSILPHLFNFNNLLVITNGAQTAIALARMGIRVFSTGGEMTKESFSYIGEEAEDMLRKYNAHIAFFSCRGLDEETGIISDNSISENAIRRIMINNATESYLLCDRSKIGKKYLNTLCNVKNISGVIKD